MSEFKNSIEDLIKDDGTSISYDYQFRKVLEYFIPSLKYSENVIRKALTEVDIDRYRFDFYGLLASLKISEDLWWVTTRVNDFTSPTQLDYGFSLIIVPDVAEYRTLVNAYRSNTAMRARRAKKLKR